MTHAMTEDAILDDERQYGHGPLSLAELEAKYPGRPHNASRTLPFHQLFTTLFNPLNEIRKRRGKPTIARAKQGPHGPRFLPPHELRRNVIERFVSRWRQEVGNDFYPALRLIIPEKDRDRAMYGLKEKTIAKLLVRLLKIDKNSEDAQALLNWKLPGQHATSQMAGDFSGRCFEVLSRRPMRVSVGEMRIAQVNELLDQLSAAQKEDAQFSIFQIFYESMNAEELMWLTRIILRQMKVGATERTFLELWHPDGEALFNVSSSLRRVCWELVDPSFRLTDDSAIVTLMECFQPQLAQFQMRSFQKMVDNMRPTVDDQEFWIEEKLDGERIQLHMREDHAIPGGMAFKFWSRKAKDYTYLYGSGLQDENSALTRHLSGAFNPGVRNLILDGEMITWDPEADMMVPFGTLKSAALSEQRNPYQGTCQRPLFRVFDILYLNDQPLTRYALRERRDALNRCVTDIPRRMEKLDYSTATSVEAIEPRLRKVIAEASEGLVLKNPRSSYQLNSRNDDWMKVKPEYMTEFGESLDCVVIGGYYGSGHRGGRLSSFLCGLRVDRNHVQQGAHPQKCYSFFKVGGGFRAEDYATIRHHTDGKWLAWDSKKPPFDYIELGGHMNNLQLERPDQWIMPEDSVVLSVKAASVSASDTFRIGYTLRFPRFKKLRLDRDWKTALSVQEFIDLKSKIDEEVKAKSFKIDTGRRKSKKAKSATFIAGTSAIAPTAYPQTARKVFRGRTFCVLSEGPPPTKKSKAALELMIKAHGGVIRQNPVGSGEVICIADKNVIKVASLIKAGKTSIVRSKWLADAIQQEEVDSVNGSALQVVIPFEPDHMLYRKADDDDRVRAAIDDAGDSFARDLTSKEMGDILSKMARPLHSANVHKDMARIEREMGGEAGKLFSKCKFFVSGATGRSWVDIAKNEVRFEDGDLTANLDDSDLTHIVAVADDPELPSLRRHLSNRAGPVPRIVTPAWIHNGHVEHTALDEEAYAPLASS